MNTTQITRLELSDDYLVGYMRNPPTFGETMESMVLGEEYVSTFIRIERNNSNEITIKSATALKSLIEKINNSL